MTKRRQKGDAKHVRLYNGMMASEAWRALSGNAVKLLVYVASYEGPTQPNGSIYCSARHGAAGIGVNKRTALKAFQELQEKGFLRSTAKGHFLVKGGPATAWRLTWLAWPGVMSATKDYENWTPEKNKTRVQKLSAVGVKNAPLCDELATAGAENTPIERSSPQNSVKAIGVKSAPHSIAMQGGFSGAAPAPEFPPEIHAGQIEAAA